jgi:hypothetical protein
MGDLLDLSRVQQAVFVASSTRQYRNEGDHGMYTSEMLQQRRLLRNHPGVEAWLKKFWHVFEKGTPQIPKEQYLDFQLKLCRALFDDDDWSLDAAQRMVEQDWDREFGPASTAITEEQFMDSLFETIDVWTESAAAEEYLRFFAQIFESLTVPDERTRRRRFKDLEDISSMDHHHHLMTEFLESADPHESPERANNAPRTRSSPRAPSTEARGVRAKPPPVRRENPAFHTTGSPLSNRLRGRALVSSSTAVSRLLGALLGSVSDNSPTHCAACAADPPDPAT